jgi:hypothetical protein
MIQGVPLQLVPGATHLMTGRALNQLIAALQARTQIDAGDIGPRGMTGSNPKGGGPKIPRVKRGRYDDARTYVLSPALLARLEAALGMRTPRGAGSMDARGWDLDEDGSSSPGIPHAARDGGSLKAVQEAIQRASPRGTAETNPQGYRFPPPPRAPRSASVLLEIQDRWAGAKYCTGISHGGELFDTYQQVSTYTNGTITTTTTQPDPGPHVYTSTIPDYSCPSTTVDDNEDPHKDYGELLNTEVNYSGALTLGASYSVASDGIEDAGDPVTAATWSWLEGGAAAFSPETYQLARWTNGGLGLYLIHRPKYRWRNTGALHVRIQWYEDSGAEDLILAPGEDSDWFLTNVPAAVGAYSTLNTIVLSRPA